MLSFDITDRHIRIIRGVEGKDKIKVSSAFTIDVEEGLIVNGHIKDIPKMATLINNELKKNKMGDKDAVISISSNLIVFKELNIPKAKGSQLLQMVQNQMQHTMGISDDYSISYTIAGEIEEDGVTALKVLATACPFEVVDGFRKVFSMLNISLRSVAVTCNTITRIILSDPSMKGKMPLLLVQIDPNFVSLNLYENDQLTFSRFASIDPVDYDNSPDYVYEAVSENIHRMFQFQKTRSSEALQNVIFYGDTTEYIRLTNSLEQIDITTGLLSVPKNVGGYENFEFQAYANAIGAMFKNNKESERINLLEVDAAVGRTSAGVSFVVTLMIWSVIAAALVAGAAFFFYNQEVQYNRDITEIQEFLDSPETFQKNKAIDDMQKKIDMVNIYKTELDNANFIYETMPTLDTEKIEKINENIAGTSVEIKFIEYGEGFYTVEMTAEKNDEPAKVAAKYIEQDYFSNVIYTGYTYNAPSDDDGIITEESFSFTISFNEKKELPEDNTAEGEVE